MLDLAWDRVPVQRAVRRTLPGLILPYDVFGVVWVMVVAANISKLVGSTGCPRKMLALREAS